MLLEGEQVVKQVQVAGRLMTVEQLQVLFQDRSHSFLAYHNVSNGE